VVLNKKAKITHILSEKFEQDCDLLINLNGKLQKDKVLEVFENSEKVLKEVGENQGLISVKNLVVNKKGKSEPKVAIDGTRYSVASMNTGELKY